MTAFWMPAAISTDLPAGTAMPVATEFGALALWRSQSGRVSAFADRCPHRGMRLSHGFVRGEALSCIYHGWGYGTGGECLRIPAHPKLAPPASIRVERYAVEEADGIVWIAPGQSPGPVPPLAGFVPMRSLTVNAPLAAVEAEGTRTGTAGLHRIETAGTAFAVLLAPEATDRTLIHVMVRQAASPAERIAVSRAAETLRRTVEALSDKEAA